MVMSGRFAGSSDWSPDPSMIAGPSLLTAMWRRRYVIVVSAIVAFAVGYVLSSTQAPVYSATATVFLTDPSAADLFGNSRVDPERHVQQEAGRMQARAVFVRASELLTDDVGPNGVAASVNVVSNIPVGLVSVNATAGSPQGAADIANAVVSAYEQISGEEGRDALNAASAVLNEQTRELQQQAERLQAELESDPDDAAAASTLEAVQAQLTALRMRLSEVATEIAIYGAGVDSVEQAVPPLAPSGPKPVRDAMAAAMLGVALASAYAYWRAGVKQSVQADLGGLLDAPLLAEIPRFNTNDTAKLLFDAQAIEAYQFMVPSLDFALAQTGGTSVLVTSATPGEGKSLTALHLTRALATQGRRVVLVDSSLRTQELSSLLRADDQPGLAELAGGAELDQAVRSYRVSPTVRLSLVPAGHPPTPPTGMLATSGCRKAIARIIDAYEMTIIDGEAMLAVADVSALAQQVAGIVLVVDAHTPHETLAQVRERLSLVPTPLLGYVINRAPSTHSMISFLSRSSGRNGHEHEMHLDVERPFDHEGQKARTRSLTARRRSDDSRPPPRGVDGAAIRKSTPRSRPSPHLDA